jgi:hypothetical protein
VDRDFFSEISKNLSHKKVGIEEFSESSDYCGKRLYPRQLVLLKLIFLEEMTGKEEDILTHWLNGGRNGNEILLSPKIRERRDYLRGLNYSHFREIVLVGGRRSSKGFVTGMAMAKKMYDTLQLHDPGLHYGIDPDKEIYFSCIATSQDQAKKYQYADFSSTIARCRAMEDNLTKLQELEFSVATEADRQRIEHMKNQGRKIGRDISKLRGVALAANASSVRGSATMAAVFDEMAHMQQEGEGAQTAASVYDALTPSLAQFGKDAMILCNSSPYTKIGKFYERYEDGLKLKDGKPLAPMMFTFRFPSWGLFEGYQRNVTKWHRSPQRKVITASPDWDLEDSQWSPEDKDAILIERDTERQDPDTYKVERRAEFAEIIDAFLKPEMIDRAYLGKPTRDGGYVTMRTNWSNPSFHYRYKAHLDPSSTTAGFGFAMGHIEELEEQDGRDRSHVVFDIIHRWTPEQFPEGVVDWEVVLRDITGWIDQFQPYEVTFDQFQSQAPIQWLNRWLREKGLSQILVYEKTATAQYNWNRANVFRTALYQDLVHIPGDTPAALWGGQELKHLQQINTAGRFPRIDKQEIGPVQTKDIADCIMEVTDALIGNIIANDNRASLGDLEPAFGAQGGYAIGRDNRMDQSYTSNKSVHSFSEMRKGAGPMNKEQPSAADKVREQLGGLTASRSGSWQANPNRNRGGGRSRGF